MLRHATAAASCLALAVCSGDSESAPEPECAVDADCPGHVDDLCFPGARCAEGACVTAAPLDCSRLAVPQCFEPRCDTFFGGCFASEINYVPCDDGDACTEGDACYLGECVPEQPKHCGDPDPPCKLVTCDPATGCDVELAPLGTPCAADEPCVVGAACDGMGACVKNVRDCDDDDPCTVDRCGASGCEHVAHDGAASCDDGDPCTRNDLCEGVTCVGTPIAEGGGCATSHCLSGQTCQGGACVGGAPVDDDTPCEEDFACVGLATCQGGACVGPTVVCPDDHNPCTDDACTPNRGCLYRPIVDGDPCDLDACAVGGTCDNGLCTGLVIADDGAACTPDDACVTGATCRAGACGGGDASACLPVPSGPLAGGFLVTDNARSEIALVDRGGNLATTFEGEAVGAAGVALDHARGAGFFVTYTGAGGAHTLHALGWDGAPGDDVVHTGQWTLTGPCHDRLSSTGSWLVADCGSNRVVHDYAGNLIFAGPNGTGSTRGVALVSFESFWILEHGGALRYVMTQLGGTQQTIATGLSAPRGLERAPYGFYVGVPEQGQIVQLDNLGRRVRRIPLPAGVDLWDFAWIP